MSNSENKNYPIVSIKGEGLKIAYDNYVAVKADKLEASGNIIALIGHNGAGKSTFIKGLLNLLPISEGSLKTKSLQHGNSIVLESNKHMAFCPETGSIFEDISVESYIKLWCRLKHGKGKYYRNEGSHFIDILNIPPLLKKLGRELSKGQRRRVQTAIGFLIRPKFFIFDEPFDGLDIQKTNELAEIIISESSDTAFLISSHRMDVVERLANRILVIKEGEFVANGSVENVTTTLAGSGAFIQGAESYETIIDKLNQAFPKLLVNHIGENISITGTELNLEEIELFLKNNFSKDLRFGANRPSLVDAMNFHLRELTASEKYRNE